MLRSLSTESLARGSANRPWVTIAIWVVVLVAAIVLIFGLLGDALTTQFTFTNTPESQRGVDLIEELRGLPRSTNEVVIVQSDNFGVDDPEFRQLVESLYTELRALGPGVIRQDTLIHYYQFQAPFLVSEDRRATIIPFTMAGNFDDATDNIEKVVELVESAEKQAGLEVLITGQATAGKDFQEVGQSDLEKGEAYGVPIALVILVVVLGAVVAALVPVVLAFVAILIAMGVAALVGQAFALSFFVTNIIFMIGLAVGIDYSLFIIARYREERARGLDKHAAIARAGSTASRAVFFSGMTVVLALIGMVLIPSNIYIGVGIGAILVVIASVCAALTLLPAFLGLLGDRINWLTIPWIGKGAVYVVKTSGTKGEPLKRATWTLTGSGSSQICRPPFG